MVFARNTCVHLYEYAEQKPYPRVKPHPVAPQKMVRRQISRALRQPLPLHAAQFESSHGGGKTTQGKGWFNFYKKPQMCFHGYSSPHFKEISPWRLSGEEISFTAATLHGFENSSWPSSWRKCRRILLSRKIITQMCSVLINN